MVVEMCAKKSDPGFVYDEQDRLWDKANKIDLVDGKVVGLLF